MDSNKLEQLKRISLLAHTVDTNVDYTALLAGKKLSKAAERMRAAICLALYNRGRVTQEDLATFFNCAKSTVSLAIVNRDAYFKSAYYKSIYNKIARHVD
jgi:hypothetical protein